MRLPIIRVFAAFSTICIWACAPSPALAQEGGACGQAAFAAAVSESGGALSAMNDQKRRTFMEKLQALKAQENWSDEDYAANAKTYVQDEKILAFDGKGKELLAKVQALGGGESLTDEKRCAMLGELKTLLTEVVRNTREKWDYMFAKISGALKPVTASSAPPKAQAPGAQAKAPAPKPQGGGAPKAQAAKSQAPTPASPSPSPASAPPQKQTGSTAEEWQGGQ